MDLLGSFPVIFILSLLSNLLLCNPYMR